MIWLFRLGIFSFIFCIFFKIYLFYLAKNEALGDEFLHFKDLLILFLALFLFVLLFFAINFFLYIIPFFNRNNFTCKKNHKIALAYPEKTKIFAEFSKKDFDILFCGIFELKKPKHLVNIDLFYVNFYFFGVYLRLKKNINNDFEIFASENLINLYHPNGFRLKKRFLTDNVEFNKKFYLYPSKNIANDFKFLNPKKLSNIANAAKPIKKKFSLIYTKDYLEIYIHNFLFSSNIKNEFESILKIIKEFNEV